LWLILLGLLGRTRKSPDAVVVVETPVAPAA